MGLRTHFLVAMAAATFVVVSAQFVYAQSYGRDDLVNVDGSRIAASVVSGIGVLAGGSILRSGMTVQGITTAAGLWLVTAIGLFSGAGMYIEAVSVTAIGIPRGLTRLIDRLESQPGVRRIHVQAQARGARPRSLDDEIAARRFGVR